MSTFMITGASDGIGLETAKQLAHQGHELILHGRNAEKAQHARDSILRMVPNVTIYTAHADLADLAAVVQMANDLNSRIANLNVLLNNAGVYMLERKLSIYDFEMTLAVNHLAHFLLTALLLPLLKTSAEPRVVTVSSIAHMSGRIDFNNLNSEQRFDGYDAYANSKLASALFAAELARRESWLTSNSLHPGVIDTKLLHTGFNMTGSSVSEGALTSVFLASSPAVKGISGKFFDDCKPTPPATVVHDAALAQQLWQWSEKAIGQALIT